jgi:hypothetical protein
MVAFATNCTNWYELLVKIRVIRGKRDHLSKKFVKSAGKGKKRYLSPIIFYILNGRVRFL